MCHQRNKLSDRVFPWGIALCFAVPLLYLLSYAPVVRLLGSPSYSLRFEPLIAGRVDYGGLVLVHVPTVEVHHNDGSRLPCYRPVDALIDHTHLREPLLCWADMLEVGNEFRSASDERLASL